MHTNVERQDEGKKGEKDQQDKYKNAMIKFITLYVNFKISLYIEAGVEGKKLASAKNYNWVCKTSW